VRGQIEGAILYGRSKVPFEVIVERLCQKYHKLPSEILEEDAYWIRMLLEINRVDAQVEQMEEKRAKLKDMARNGRN